jgi:hypothetical protein
MRISVSLIMFAVLVAGCAAEQATQPAAKPDAPANDAYKKLEFNYQKPAIVGTEVRVAAEDLPAGKTVELQWGTVTGGWVIEDYYHFKGRNTPSPRLRLENSMLIRTAGWMPVSRFRKITAAFTK